MRVVCVRVCIPRGQERTTKESESDEREATLQFSATYIRARTRKYRLFLYHYLCAADKRYPGRGVVSLSWQKFEIRAARAWLCTYKAGKLIFRRTSEASRFTIAACIKLRVSSRARAQQLIRNALSRAQLVK